MREEFKRQRKMWQKTESKIKQKLIKILCSLPSKHLEGKRFFGFFTTILLILLLSQILLSLFVSPGIYLAWSEMPVPTFRTTERMWIMSSYKNS